MSQHTVEARGADVVSAMLRALPRGAALWLGRRLGGLMGILDTRHVALAVENLRRAYPDWDEPRLLEVARGVYVHFGLVLLDLLWLQGRSREEILKAVEVEGQEHVERAMAAGRGVIMATAHMGNWEVHGVAHGWIFGAIDVIARPLDNPALDLRLNALRGASGNTIVYKQRALARVLKSLRAGRGVAILVDQNVQAKEGVFVEYFGRPAATTTVVAALVLKTGCAVVPAQSEALPDGRYRIIYDPPLTWTPSGNRDADILRITQDVTRQIETWVRRAPQQWLWMHRRWKTQPEDAA